MSAPERPGPERPGPDYPAEWDDEPDEADEADEHDAWHPVWIEGCDACVDRARHLDHLDGWPWWS